jgi:archaemetzincin
MDSRQISVEVIPLGPVASRLLQVVAANVFALYRLPAVIGGGADLPQAAFDGRRHQYDAAVLLKHLENRKGPPCAGKTIAVTAVDIFIPIFSHVYGEARQGGTSAVVSTHRLGDVASRSTSESASAELYLRAVKVALHELGHLFQMSHCEDRRCLMHYADTLDAIDRTPLQFCRYCRAELPT